MSPGPWCAALSLCLAALAHGNSLVGPGAVGSYQGGGGGRRFGGYVRVQDPPVGLFVAGSSIKAMNGLYGKQEDGVPIQWGRDAYYVYRHDFTGWYMALVHNTEAESRRDGTKSSWMLYDNDGVERFRSQGDKLIPSAGEQWKHVHKAKSGSDEPDASAGTQVAKDVIEDDLEELPWQVIGIGSEQMLEQLRGHFRYYQHTVQQAIQGRDLLALPPASSGSQASSPPDGFVDPSALDPSTGDADCGVEDTGVLQDLLSQSVRDGDLWAQAACHRRLALCHRLRRDFAAAEGAVNAALALFPRYGSALLERGLALLDAGRLAEAKRAFEVLLKVDRAWPSVDDFLVRVHVYEKREETARLSSSPYCNAWQQTAACDPWGHREPEFDLGCNQVVPSGVSGRCECKRPAAEGSEEVVIFQASPSNCDARESFTCAERCQRSLPAGAAPTDPCAKAEAPDWCSTVPYRVLGVRCDLPRQKAGEELDDLKYAYKRRSLQVHPDKRGGSVRAFQAVADAHGILSVPEKRQQWDDGEDLPREAHHDGSQGPSFRDKILKQYFPERFGFEPFGNPHGDRIERAQHQKRRLERQRQEALARGEEL